MVRITLHAAFVVALVAQASPAFSVGRCLEVTNVPADNYLYVRSRASATARVLVRLPPQPSGVVQLDGECTPTSVVWEHRWCPVIYVEGDRTVSGWIKAQWAKEVDCPG